MESLSGNTLSRNPNNQYSYQDKKDGMWLGVSLDVQQNSVRNDIVVSTYDWNILFYSNFVVIISNMCKKQSILSLS